MKKTEIINVQNEFERLETLANLNLPYIKKKKIFLQ